MGVCESWGFVLLAVHLERRLKTGSALGPSFLNEGEQSPCQTHLSNIVRLAHLVNHPPRRMLFARYDRNHVPGIPVPIHDGRLVSFALSDCLDFKAKPVAGGPGAGDVEFLGAVATTNYCTTAFGA